MDDLIRDAIGVNLHVAKISKHHSDFSDLDEMPECEDAVSRKTLKKGFEEMCDLNCPYTKKQRHFMCGSCVLGSAFDVLEATPSVMAIKALEQPERECGVWLPDNNNYITPHFVCSACGMSQKVETVMYKPIWAFCPRCGARMMEGEQE